MTTDKPALLQEALTEVEAKHALAYGVGTTALATLAERARHVMVVEPSMVARAKLQASVQPANIMFLDDVALPPEQRGQFDLAAIEAPQSRVLARRWLVEAHAALCEGGALYLAGLNDGGVRPLIDDLAALFGDAHTIVTKRRGRVARALKQPAQTPPDWAQNPGIVPGTWYGFDLELPDEHLRLASLPGVFSYDRLDIASSLLLEHLHAVPAARVLDVGCGYGIIGLALARRGAASVDMLDENRYAVASARRNAALLGLTTVRVEAADVRTAPFRGPYSLVVTNPPFHRGKQVDYDAAHAFIVYARSVLEPQGRLVLVANSFIRYDQTMRKHFATVVPLAQTPSFTVWQASN